MKRLVRRSTLPIVLLLLVAAFWASSDFQEISAGVAIFLFGMIMLEEGFSLLSGGLLERILERSTRTLPRSILFGFVTTTVMQSSALVSVVTISFLSAGLLSLVAGVGIVFGANIGSTTGAWLVAGLGLKVNIASFAMPMLALAIVLVFQKRKPVRGGGYVLGGIGFLFLGIHYMKTGFDDFAGQFDLTKFAIGGVAGLLVYTLIGVVATAVMQSSHASLVLVITALAAGQITYENALALAIGANIGSTVTAVIGATTANYMGRRLAGAHVVFNSAMAVVALSCIIPLKAAVTWISDTVGIAPDDYALRLAVFHTLINTIGVLMMIPVLPLLLRTVERWFPAVEPEISQPRYLSGAVSAIPATLQVAVAKEVEHLYSNALDLIARGINLRRADMAEADDLARYVEGATQTLDVDFDRDYELRVKGLHGAILEFVSHRTGGDLPKDTAERLTELRIAAERIVRAVKEVKHLRANTSLYTATDHGVATELYNELRINLARIVIELDGLAAADPRRRSILWLEDERDRIRHEKTLIRPLVEQLLRSEDLDALTATSFINDANYGFRAMKEMLEGAQALYSDPDESLADVERLLSMDDDDVDDDQDAARSR